MLPSASPPKAAHEAHARPKRAARLARNNTGLDMNLVALIDIFTILIFFLMSSTGIEVLTNSRAVKLPTSVAEQAPRQTITVSVSETDIVVDGRRWPTWPGPQLSDDLIPGLKAELDLLANRQVLGADKTAPAKRDHPGRQAHPLPPAAQGHGHQRPLAFCRGFIRRAEEDMKLQPLVGRATLNAGPAQPIPGGQGRSRHEPQVASERPRAASARQNTTERGMEN